MLNNPYFFILLSFLIFLYIGYKKVWPDIVSTLKSDIENIKNRFSTLEAKKLTLKAELKNLASGRAIFDDELQQIHNTSLANAENIKNVYMKDMEILSQHHFSHIDKIYLRMVQRFEYDSLHFFSQQLRDDLIRFFETQKDEKAFQKEILEKSFILLQKQ